jgi:hypothetical protein
LGETKDQKTILADDFVLGRWLGVAHAVGQAMTSWILKKNGCVIARSSAQPLKEDEICSEPEKQARL